ncbi:hypothetical protein LP421_29110 [Rhizobium sp. RCAM05350]|nr:hypothetical protein LP421_29110 [Rhizobium sp. RCAM05350]
MRISTHPQAMGMALGLIGVTIFGVTLPMTHIALGGFSPFFITFGRAVIASIAAGLTLLLMRKNGQRDKARSCLGPASAWSTVFRSSPRRRCRPSRQATAASFSASCRS